MLAGNWQNFEYETVSATEASKLLPKWLNLIPHLIESAGFNAPELVLPILQHANQAKVATVQLGTELHFVLPMCEGRSYNSSWITPLTAADTPHVDELGLTEFIAAQAKPFLFQAIQAEGPFHKLLRQQAQRYSILESWVRACLRPVGTYENWLHTNFDQKRRKEFKRQRTRLSEQGDLQTEILSKADDVDSFTEDFLSLEVSGWKGKKGTAISANAGLAEATRQALRNLHASGKLRFWNLKLDGKSIASLFAIVEGDQAWLGKIAYDETYAKFSPGALIILDCTESFFAEPAITQIDSSAIPNHPLIDRIWRDRLAMVSIFIGSENLNQTQFNLTVALAKQKLKWRNRLRDLYYRALGKRRS